MKVYEGTILTVDARDSVARYLVEDAGIIAYVGDTLPAQFEGAPIERLQSRALALLSLTLMNIWRRLPRSMLV